MLHAAVSSLLVALLPQQLRQLRHVGRDPPRLIASSHKTALYWPNDVGDEGWVMNVHRTTPFAAALLTLLVCALFPNIATAQYVREVETSITSHEGAVLQKGDLF
jgi:hypothetical protein